MQFHLRYILLAAFVAVACGKKSAEGTQAPAAVTAPQVISGLYTSAREGDCLCVNTERKAAGSTGLMSAMGGDVSLGKAFDILDKDDSRKTALLENFKQLKATGKDSIRSGDTLYVRVSKAKNCEILNSRILSEVDYEQACLGEGNRDNIRVEEKKLD